jgi:hypothetical protein
MKNFYEATVIKDTLLLDISMLLTPIEQCYCQLSINDNILLDDVLTAPKQLEFQMPLLSNLEFNIKIVREHPQAIIVNLDIDGNEIIPLYLNSAVPPTNYLNFNGDWVLSIPNFYVWYHNITGQGWIA